MSKIYISIPGLTKAEEFKGLLTGGYILVYYLRVIQGVCFLDCHNLGLLLFC